MLSPFADCCEHSIETSVFITGGKFANQASECHVLDMGFCFMELVVALIISEEIYTCSRFHCFFFFHFWYLLLRNKHRIHEVVCLTPMSRLCVFVCFVSLLWSPCNYYIRTYLLTPWSRVLLEKLTGFHLVKKFPAFYGTRRFITAFTSARHLSLFWASSILSITPHPTSWRFILILSSHLRLGLPSGLYPSDFSTKSLYTPPLSPLRVTCPAYLIPLDLSPEQYWVMSTDN